MVNAPTAYICSHKEVLPTTTKVIWVVISFFSILAVTTNSNVRNENVNIGRGIAVNLKKKINETK